MFSDSVNAGAKQALFKSSLRNCLKIKQKRGGYFVLCKLYGCYQSLGSEYFGEEILYLYKSRWQVELLFKRLKQSLSITTIKAGSTAYAETLVLLQLILWLLAERQSFLCKCFLKEKEKV